MAAQGDGSKALVEDNSNLDAAAIYLKEQDYTPEYLELIPQDVETHKKIVRRVDLTLMPLLCVTFLLNYVDKLTLNYSAVFDLFETTGILQHQYSWMASIFYFAYLFCEWPSSYLAQRLPTGTVVASFVLCWGSVMLLTVISEDFTGLAICRFFLGASESIVIPTFMMIVSQWYVKREQPARTGAFYCMNGVGAMLGAAVFYATGHIKTFPVWKTMFIICGGCTVLWGVVLMIHLPNNLMTAKKTGVLNQTIKTRQIWEALTDPQVWLLFIFTLLNETINGGFANFGQLILKGVANNDPLLTTAYGIPQGGFQVVYILSGAWLASRYKNIRTYIMMIYLAPTVIGISLLWKLDRSDVNGCLMGYYIFGAYVASLVLALQLPASNVGSYTQRVTATAFVFLGYCAGNIIGTHAFLGEEAPIYPTGCKMMISCAAGQIVVAALLRALLVRRNKRRDQEAAVAGVNMTTEAEEEMCHDLTDVENPRFRYVY